MRLAINYQLAFSFLYLSDNIDRSVLYFSLFPLAFSL